MATAKHKAEIIKAKQDWKSKFNEMRFSLAIVQAVHSNLPWYRKLFWRKAGMQKLVKQNEEIINIPQKQWRIYKQEVFKRKNYEFNKNYYAYMDLLDEKKEIVIKKDGIEQDFTELGKAAFKH